MSGEIGEALHNVAKMAENKSSSSSNNERKMGCMKPIV